MLENSTDPFRSLRHFDMVGLSSMSQTALLADRIDPQVRSEVLLNTAGRVRHFQCQYISGKCYFLNPISHIIHGACKHVDDKLEYNPLHTLFARLYVSQVLGSGCHVHIYWHFTDTGRVTFFIIAGGPGQKKSDPLPTLVTNINVLDLDIFKKPANHIRSFAF